MSRRSNRFAAENATNAPNPQHDPIRRKRLMLWIPTSSSVLPSGGFMAQAAEGYDMVMQLNIGDHTSSEAEYIAFPARHLRTVRWARTRALWVARNKPAADVYYRGLPGGRSLTELLADSSIWVNYAATMPHFGETNAVSGKEIAISERSFRIGRWTVLATLVHELAHSNGADGEPSRAAEEAVLACGMGYRSERASGSDDPFTPYDPTISG